MLNRAFEEKLIGTLEQVIVQLHLSGTARSGKTSLIRRLMGKKARETEPSTGVADKAVRVDIVKRSVVVDETIWKEIKDLNEESTFILNGMRSEMSKADTLAAENEYVNLSGANEDTAVGDSEQGTPELQPDERSASSAAAKAYIS